jgi:hypothetical protein
VGRNNNKSKVLDNLFLLRCIVTKVCKGHFEAKDYNGKKYIIKKNEATKNFKEGTDSTFYATKKINGWFFKKVVLYPLTDSEYREFVVQNEKDKNIS